MYRRGKSATPQPPTPESGSDLAARAHSRVAQSGHLERIGERVSPRKHQISLRRLPVASVSLLIPAC